MKELTKQCSVCGKEIKVTVAEDKTYIGGHHFGKIVEGKEYWECNECFNL